MAVNRRDFIRRFVLTLLALVFGPRIYELIDNDELEAFCGLAVDRWPRGRMLTQADLADMIDQMLNYPVSTPPDLIIVPLHRLEQIREILESAP